MWAWSLHVKVYVIKYEKQGIKIYIPSRFSHMYANGHLCIFIRTCVR